MRSGWRGSAPAGATWCRFAGDGTDAPPGALSCTDGARYEEAARRAGVPLSTKVEFNDIAGLEAVVDRSVAAVILEPVQGIQGARDFAPEFLEAAREICTRAGAALIFDEIQCGVGRSGAFTAAEAYGVVPDALTLAKGLAAGLPIGTTVINPWLAEGLTIGDLGSTFGGGPVVCAATLANLDVIERDGLIANTIAIGERIRAGALAARCEGSAGTGTPARASARPAGRRGAEGALPAPRPGRNFGRSAGASPHASPEFQRGGGGPLLAALGKVL